MSSASSGVKRVAGPALALIYPRTGLQSASMGDRRLAGETAYAETSPSSGDLWARAPDPTRRPELRLLCFPYAGGGASTYHRWTPALPREVEVCPVLLPGRPPRIDSEPYRSVPGLVTAAASALESHLDLPIALYGHSFGAICAFEFARELRRRGFDLPIHLFVSAILAPHKLAESLSMMAADTSKLDDRGFITQTGAAILNRDALDSSPELAQLTLPVLRADTEALASYRYVAEPPIDCPISVLAGSEDQLMPAGALKSWEELTSRRFELRSVRGGHWFVDTHIDAFTKNFRGMLNRTLRALRTARTRQEAAPC